MKEIRLFWKTGIFLTKYQTRSKQDLIKFLSNFDL